MGSCSSSSVSPFSAYPWCLLGLASRSRSDLGLGLSVLSLAAAQTLSMAPRAYLVKFKFLSLVFEVLEDLLPAFHSGLGFHQRACPGVRLTREAGCAGSTWMGPWQRAWRAAETSSWSGLEYPPFSLLPGHSVQDAWEFQCWVLSSLYLGLSKKGEMNSDLLLLYVENWVKYLLCILYSYPPCKVDTVIGLLLFVSRCLFYRWGR